MARTATHGRTTACVWSHSPAALTPHARMHARTHAGGWSWLARTATHGRTTACVPPHCPAALTRAGGWSCATCAPPAARPACVHAPHPAAWTRAACMRAFTCVQAAGALWRGQQHPAGLGDGRAEPADLQLQPPGVHQPLQGLAGVQGPDQLVVSVHDCGWINHSLAWTNHCGMGWGGGGGGGGISARTASPVPRRGEPGRGPLPAEPTDPPNHPTAQHPYRPTTQPPDRPPTAAVPGRLPLRGEPGRGAAAARLPHPAAV